MNKGVGRGRKRVGERERGWRDTMSEGERGRGVMRGTLTGRGNCRRGEGGCEGEGDGEGVVEGEGYRDIEGEGDGVGEGAEREKEKGRRRGRE